MAYTLEQLSADCHAAMAADNGPAGREKVRDYISVACGDSAFVAEHFENPAIIKDGGYITPKEPGYSVRIKDSSIKKFDYNEGTYWK